MAFPKNPNTIVESIVFDGYTYNRYPESKAHSRYYIRTGGQSLHRAIWEKAHGPIPEGNHVHHKDGNVDNNTLENYECLSGQAHMAEHSVERSAYGKSAKHQEHLATIRPLAAEWHKSEEGRAWHRENAKTSLAKALAAKNPNPEYQHTCGKCGCEFSAKSPKAEFCGPACWRQHHNEVKRARSLAQRTGYICAKCGVSFTAAMGHQKYCSTDCKTAANNAKKRVQPEH